MRFIVSEFESTLEVIKYTLDEYEIPSATTDQVVADLRAAFRGSMET